jgi:DNA-binding transcriptional MerR regulator
VKDGLLSISELAHFSRTTRDTLLFYDKIGLIRPQHRAASNYRYYSFDQIAAVNLIRTFQMFGMKLEEIKSVMNKRTPQMFLDRYESFYGHLQEKIDALRREQDVLESLRGIITEGLAADTSKVEYGYHEAESIYLGPKNDYSNGQTDYDNLIKFYEYCWQRDPNINLNWAAWGLFKGERVLRHDWRWPDYFYFNRPGSPDAKPAGYYVTAYTHGPYSKSDAAYERLLAYIDEQGLEIVGDAFESYILNEIAEPDPNNYLIRVSIQVSKICYN